MLTLPDGAAYLDHNLCSAFTTAVAETTTRCGLPLVMGAMSPIFEATSEQVAELSKHDSTPWGQYLNKGIGEYNAKFAVSNAQKIQKYAVVAGDFSERGGELTATLKLKRGPTTEKYKDLIDALYCASTKGQVMPAVYYSRAKIKLQNLKFYVKPQGFTKTPGFYVKPWGFA